MVLTRLQFLKKEQFFHWYQTSHKMTKLPPKILNFNQRCKRRGQVCFSNFVSGHRHVSDKSIRLYPYLIIL